MAGAVDMRVLRAIRRSPLALDLYAWATWRVFKMSKSSFIPWDGLMEQMGSEYSDSKEFARKAKAGLQKIRAVYPALKIDYAKGGFILRLRRLLQRRNSLIQVLADLAINEER